MALTYNPSAGFMLNGQLANLYGTSGRNVLGAATRDRNAGGDYDPRYYEAYTYNNGDAGEQTGYRLRSEIAERLGGRTQLASHSVGGYGEVIDPSQVTWDDEFGLLTNPTNIKDPATPRDNLMGSLAMAAWAAPIAYGVALDSGLLGASGFPEGAGIAGDGIGGLEVSDEMRALLEQGTAAHGAAADAAANFGIEQGLGVLNGLPTGVISDALGSGASSLLSNLNNPANLARLLMGGAGLANAASNRNNSNSNNPGGGNPTNYDLPAGVQSFNPAGLLGGYTPRQVSLVPFMSQSSLLGGK